jgi:hypothetical protein
MSNFTIIYNKRLNDGLKTISKRHLFCLRKTNGTSSARTFGRTPLSGCPTAALFRLRADDDSEDGWGAATVRRGQEHTCFETERPGTDLGGKVELTGDAELCSAQKTTPHGAGLRRA